MTPDAIRQTYDALSRLTVWQALERTALRLPDKTALVEGDRRLTFSQLRARAEELSRGLAARGLRKGDVAAIYMRNSVEFVTVFYALQRLGVVVAWLNPLYRETEARFILEDSGARTVFLFEEWQGFRYLEAVASLRSGLPKLETVVVAPGPGAAGGRGPGVVALSEIGAPGGEAVEVTTDDLSMLIYTSGTTGRPKGAAINQSQVVRAGFSYTQGVDACEDDVFLGFLPMSHAYGCGSLLLQPILLGATLVLLDRFSTTAAFDLIERERCTIQLAAPAHYLMELADPTRASRDLRSLRAGLIAGQIAPEGLIARVQEEMGLYLSSFLGSSEVGPGLSIILPFGTPLAVREESIGYPIEGTRARVVDPVTGEDLAPGQPGELLLSGWHVMQGYWNNPAETANQLRDGWLHTGDLVVVDGDGRLRILGRIKEFINRGGLKIIPSELEGLLVRHPDVAEACVVPTPNPVLGESICACLRMMPGATRLTLAEVRAFLEGKVAPYKLPDELLVLDEFPRMPGGLKLNRFGSGGVRELAAQATDKETVARR